MDFLKAIPIQGLNQSIGPRKFRAVLSYRLGILIFTADSLCPFCKRDMDIYGDHVVHCASEIRGKYRHDMVCDTFADICYKSGVADRKEVHMSFLSDSVKALRPADLLVYNWDNGRDVFYDVTGTYPFTCARTTSFTPGQAISDAVTRKRNKYLDKCLAHGYEFGLLAFTTFGELGDNTCVF